MKKILIVFGTRPEAIKMAPVIKALEKDKRFKYQICVTGQHREMLHQVLETFAVKPDYDLDLMSNNQTLENINANILIKVSEIIKNSKPDLVLVHGDTSTTFSSALAAFMNKTLVGHVEAGLRTWNLNSPWPEEAFRQLTSKLTGLHFAPTKIASENLKKENVDESKICITGNTVIDALLLAVEILEKNRTLIEEIKQTYSSIDFSKKIILVTGHRRENFGEGLKNICLALKDISNEYQDIQIVYPVHLNPNVEDSVNKLLTGSRNIFLLEPLEYLPFIYFMKKSYLILTDSGGIQEEAPTFGKPVLVMRDTTERPEAVNSNTAKLVGSNRENIVKELKKLLDSEEDYDLMSKSKNPYGDGQASQKICNFIYKNLK